MERSLRKQDLVHENRPVEGAVGGSKSTSAALDPSAGCGLSLSSSSQGSLAAIKPVRLLFDIYSPKYVMHDAQIDNIPSYKDF